MKFVYQTRGEIEAFRKQSNDYLSRTTSSKEAALGALVSLGIRTPDGRLTPEYGGLPDTGYSLSACVKPQD